ncbi:hypothetical protein RGQ13_07755 [Thalassotalea psychrophila]|uniref:Uncharacterized protein n=1 Tax=Thalassotalea psychrophila TaxID=3065647 RepID=A0ABY9TYI2_9GAMM|nr:hypothetical protein RGQ13_07755 [Colwelliaceae bacterium SQ149]
MSSHRLNYYRNMFLSAAIFNFFAGATILFMFSEFYAFIGGENIQASALLEAFRILVALLVLLFGFVYFYISQNIQTEHARALATVSLIGKLIFFGVFSSFAFADQLPMGMAGLVLLDLVYSLLFLEYVRYTKG